MDRIECRKLTNAEHCTDWQEKQTFVALTAGACLLALVIAFKNILNIPADRLTVDLILSIFILGGLATSYPLVTRRRSKSAISHPGFWIAGIVLITMVIIVLHAIWLPVSVS
jgi:hypothetical protein